MKPVPDMIYNVFSGTLNPTQSINQSWSCCICCWWVGCSAIPPRPSFADKRNSTPIN